MRAPLCSVLSICALLQTDAVSAQASPVPVPTVQTLADAYRSNDMAEFERLLIADSIILRGFRGEVMGPISRADFLQRIAGCELTHVFVAGVAYQREDGIQWTCRGQEMPNDRCNDRAWGAHTRLASRSLQDPTLGIAIQELFVTSDWNDSRCGRPAPPAPPLPPRSGND